MIQKWEEIFIHFGKFYYFGNTFAIDKSIINHSKRRETKKQFFVVAHYFKRTISLN